MHRLTVLLAVGLLGVTGALAGDWPQWRGPEGNGTSPEEGLPVRWSERSNIAWKAPLEGFGVSSPIVVGNRVFLSSQLGRGALRPGNHPTLSRDGGAPEQSLGEGQADKPGLVSFLIEAFDATSGVSLWKHEFPADGDLPAVHRKSNLANPSCVSDGIAVYCWFGTGQLVSRKVDGAPLWERALAKEYGPYQIPWGHSSSPVLFKDSLILLCDHEPSSYLLALDKKTGAEVWKADRGNGLRSYSTPLLAPSHTGEELIVNSSHGLDAYDPGTGKKLWSFEEENRFPVPSASFGDGLIFTSRGYRSGPYMAIQPGGRGDVSKTHVKWRVATGAPYVSSVVYHRGLLFMVNESGVVTSVDGRNGETVWKTRVEGVHSASPVAGDGKIYLTSEDGHVTVMRAARETEILARNNLGERCLASPAISGGRLYFRTDQNLIAIDASDRGQE